MIIFYYIQNNNFIIFFLIKIWEHAIHLAIKLKKQKLKIIIYKDVLSKL